MTKAGESYSRGLTRMQVVEGLTAAFQSHPIVFFQLIVFIRYPSWATAAMVLLGFVVTQLAVTIILAKNSVGVLRSVVSSCLDRLRDCTITRYSVRDFLGNEVCEAIDSEMLSGLREMGLWRFDLEQMVSIFVVDGPRLLPQLTCFYEPMNFRSFLFIPDPPEEVRGIRKFFILHEIGHTQTNLFAKPVMMHLWIWPYLFFVIWVALTAPWNLATMAVLGAYACAAVIWWEEWKRSTAELRALDEAVADSFALSHLTPGELKRLSGNRMLSSLLDRDMDELQNTMRLARLRENIQLALQGDTDSVLARTFAFLPKAKWKMLFAAAGLTVAVGLGGGPPVAGTIGKMSILAGVLLAWLLFVLLLRAYFTYLINARTSGGPAAEPDSASSAPAPNDAQATVGTSPPSYAMAEARLADGTP